MNHCLAAAMTVDAGWIVAVVIAFIVTAGLGYGYGSRREGRRVRDELQLQIGEAGRAVADFRTCVAELMESVRHIRAELDQGSNRMATLSNEVAAGHTALLTCQKQASERFTTRDAAEKNEGESSSKFARVFERLDGINQRLAVIEGSIASLRRFPFDVEGEN